MAGNKTDTPDRKPHESREDRLKAALKANMARRKAQARARKSSGAAEAPEEKKD